MYFEDITSSYKLVKVRYSFSKINTSLCRRVVLYCNTAALCSECTEQAVACYRINIFHFGPSNNLVPRACVFHVTGGRKTMHEQKQNDNNSIPVVASF